MNTKWIAAIAALVILVLAAIWALEYVTRPGHASAHTGQVIFWSLCIYLLLISTALVIGLWEKWRAGRQAGTVLLDLGIMAKAPRGLAVYGALMILFAIAECTYLGGPMDGLLPLSLGILCMFMGLERLKIREGGIQQTCHARSFFIPLVIKWHRIESYAWEVDTLVLTLRSRWLQLFLGTVSASFRIPVHHKDAVASLLEQHVQLDAVSA